MADDVLLNKAATIERCLKRIEEEYCGHESELETNFTRQDAIILNLQRACETAIDMATHAVRIRKLGLPQESRDAFKMLEEAKLLDNELSKKMQAMVGFRNIAVRNYQKLSFPILKSILDTNLDDLRTFVRTMLIKTSPET